MSTKISWLHLSDIHFLPKKSWRDSASRESLLMHLAELFNTGSLSKPNFIFCTGDIAFGQLPESSLEDQYRDADDFFCRLREVCGPEGALLSIDRVFVVPGNHDVNRSAVNSDAQLVFGQMAVNPEKHTETINQRFDSRNKEFRDSISRLDEYGAFIQRSFPHQHDTNGRHTYTATVVIDDIKIGIAGFNSAWTCAGDEDDRNIWLAAEWQLNHAWEKLRDCTVRFGLIHHPADWLNFAERILVTNRISSEYNFWLHGHTHDAWLSPGPTCVQIAAGAIGAQSSNEFGFNITTIDVKAGSGTARLYTKKSGLLGWTVMPIFPHAPLGTWEFGLPSILSTDTQMEPEAIVDQISVINGAIKDEIDHVGRILQRNLDDALKSYSSQPRVWVEPVVSDHAETARDALCISRLDLSEFVRSPLSIVVKAPPQYGLTSFARYLAKLAWDTKKLIWVYLDLKTVKPNKSSIQSQILDYLESLGRTQADVECLIIDSLDSNDKECFKSQKICIDLFPQLQFICMQKIEDGPSKVDLSTDSGARAFKSYFLWSLSQSSIREIISRYNVVKYIGEEDSVTKRVVADLSVLNLHRTPLNCLTLLKASEHDFDESPVNRTEIIKRVLFLLFNVDQLPTYKARPDIKDCEYVLGYFCEILIREQNYIFSRDKFLHLIQEFCKDRLIGLETHVVFDVLFQNNIIIRSGNSFCFRFAYWMLYFAAHRMHQSEDFLEYIFADMRYSSFPEIIEYYTGIDRNREDALSRLGGDLGNVLNAVTESCGFPSDLNPFRFDTWITSEKVNERISEEISNGLKDSNLPASVKDDHDDKSYDKSRPYNQNLAGILSSPSVLCLFQCIRASSRALRNSDYVAPDVKRRLMAQILDAWQHVSKIVVVVLPHLAETGTAVYDDMRIDLAGKFSNTAAERMYEIYVNIPCNVVAWFSDDLFSQKMSPLLFDQLARGKIDGISRHELILLLVNRRPKGWREEILRYVSVIGKNSFYLQDLHKSLRNQYRFGFASDAMLKDIEYLIKVTGAKHVTGDREPGPKLISKIKFGTGLVPLREM